MKDKGDTRKVKAIVSHPILRVFVVSIALLISIAFFVYSLTHRVEGSYPWDFAINWTAAHALLQHMPLYDRAAMSQLSQRLVGPEMSLLYKDTFSSYISPPSTALLMVPFTLWPFQQAVFLYRIATLLAFFVGVGLAALALHPKSRLLGCSIGMLAFFTFDAVTTSLVLGQVDAWVVLGLGLGVWATSRERWWLAGIGIGLAGLLKISPLLLLAYLVLRGRTQPFYAAVLTIITLLGLTAAIGQRNDLSTFVFTIVPALSAGSLHMQNQSLPGWITRLATPNVDFLNFALDLKPFQLLSPLVAVVASINLWYLRRRQPLHILELGILIVVALLAGPITWSHYISWSIIFLVLMSDYTLWQALKTAQKRGLLYLLSGGWLLLSVPLIGFGPGAVSAYGVLRLVSGIGTLALLLWFVAGCFLLYLTQYRHHKQSSLGALDSVPEAS